MRKRWWVVLPLLLLASGVWAYTPSLAKVSPTKAVLLVDLAKERAAGQVRATQYDALEAYLAILSIQGIVNRTADRKVYLLDSPSGFDSPVGGWQAPPLDQWAIDEGMLPVPQTRAALDPAQRWPALAYLARTYRAQLKGIVRIPHITWASGNAVFDSQLAAAVTAAGQCDGVIASPAVEAYLRAAGTPVTPLADVTALSTPVEAYLWARHYFTPRTNRTAVVYLSGATTTAFDNSFDYDIATRTFVTTCDPKGYNYYFLDLLKAYPPATCIMTKGENGAEIDASEQAGHYMCIQTGGNLSVHSGFPSDAAHFPTPPEPAPLPRDPHGVYVAFYVTDGDSAFESNWSHWVFQRLSPTFGTVPVAWSFTPTFVDLFPNLVARHGAQETAMPTAFEVVADMHDGNRPRTPEGAAAYARMYRDKLQVTHGIFTTVNPFVAHYDAELAGLGATLVIHGYGGTENGNTVPWYTVGAGRTLCTFPDGCTQNGCTADEMYRALHYMVDRAPADRPVFVVVVAGSGGGANWRDMSKGSDPGPMVEAVLARCRAEAPGPRTYYPVLPRQLAATWQARTNRALGKPATASAPGAELAVDGLAHTAWTAPRGAQWLQVDLGAITAFDEVDVDWLTPPHGYRILASDDGAAWRELAAVHSRDASRALPLPARARYVRVATDSPARLRELRVVQLDRTGLAGDVGTYTNVLKKAVVGTAPRQYAQVAVDAFTPVLGDARRVLAAPAVTQREIETAWEKVGVAFRAFWATELRDPQPLREAVEHAESLAALAAPRVGVGVDAYPPDAVAPLTAAVRQAQAALAQPLPANRETELLTALHHAELYLTTSCPTPMPPGAVGNLAYHATVTCGGTAPGFHPEAVVDGAVGSLWKSQDAIEENWITLDLGALKTLATVRLLWGNTFATHYDLALSDDGAAWRMVYTTTMGGGDTETVLLSPTPARYLRLNLHAWPWPGNYQLREITVSGETWQVTPPRNR